MSNSPLVDFTRLSPNFSRRTSPIDTITIHCMACNGSIEALGTLFSDPGRMASSNYGIGSDGRVGLYVEEEKRSWCSSSSANDSRAVTIEVANCGGAPDWPVSEKAWDALIELCADICIRNGKKRMVWKGGKAAALAYQPGPDEMNMTAHRFFAAKSCPGNYLYDRFGAIAAEVNRKIEALEDENMTGEEIYRRLMAYLRSRPVSEYAEAACRKGIESGVFADGDSDGLIDDPQAPLLRQEAAALLDRLGLL